MKKLQHIMVLFESSKLAKVILCALVVCALGASFYHKAGRKFLDVESHIPATILAKMYGYDLEGYGLSFVSAEGINDTYGAGAIRILQSQYAQDSSTQNQNTQNHGAQSHTAQATHIAGQKIIPKGFGHYASTIGIQGFIFAWIYEAFLLQNFKLLYMLNTFFSIAMIMLCVWIFARIFGKAFGVILLATFAFSPLVASFASNLYFAFGFWLLPAIFSFYLYVYLYQMQATSSIKNFKNILTIALLCVGFMAAIALRAAMSYEFLTSIILFALSPFLVAFVYGFLQAICQKITRIYKADSALSAPFIALDMKASFKWGIWLFILSILGFALVFLYHTYLRGGGDLLAGLKSIYEQDFLRRMVGGNASDFPPVLTNALNASALEVIRVYLKAPYLFPLLCVGGFICIIEASPALRHYYIALLVCFALPALSWYVLGKSHSYIHRHFCFVLWYLGFWAALWYVALHKIWREKVASFTTPATLPIISSGTPAK